VNGSLIADGICRFILDVLGNSNCVDLWDVKRAQSGRNKTAR
jgi:hypothetical protein